MNFQWFKDSFQNFITGLGTYKDKSVAHTPVLNILPPQYLMNLYRGDWLSRKIIDIPAFDSTRAWRSWQAEQDQIEALEFAERSLNLQNKLMHAFIRARLWGGSLVVMGVDGQGGFDEPLDYNKVKKGDLKFVHSVGRWELGVGPLIRDITSPWYGQPEYYSRNNVEVGTSPDRNIKLPPQLLSNRTGSFFYMHPSRCIRLTGLDYPDIELAPDSWGDSVLQIVYKAISDTDLVTSAIASIVSEMKYDVIKVPGLTSKMATDEGAKQLAARFGQASLMKGTANSILIDETEEWIQMQTRVNGFDKVMQMYLLLACGAADIPATRIYGREPAGQNATGESDVRNYYDRLSSEQAVKITPTLTPLDEVLIRSTFGDRDPDIYYQWNPLWQMDEDQKSQIALRKSQAHKIDVDAGLIHPLALRTGRENQLIEDGFYPSLEAAIDEFEDPNELYEAPPAMEPDNNNLDDPDVPLPTDKQVTDTAARPLYVYRPLLNVNDLRKWAKAQGFKSMVSDPHVTLVYSKAPVNWMKMGGSSPEVTVEEGGPRVVEALCDEGAVVLHFASLSIEYRHDDLVERGCSHDCAEYQPHMTISYSADGVDLETIEPYAGELKFGPERFRAIKAPDPSKRFVKPKERKM